MKTRFSSIDIRASLADINERYRGMRVVNVYDIDSKTYLIKLARPDMKSVLLLESGNRIHGTEFEWPKNMSPSGFSMKLRKHLRTRRLETIRQIGVDRIVDLQFGSGDAAYHVILELYDRGNIVLTDFEYTILNILRPRTDKSEDVKFVVRERYPLDLARQEEGRMTIDRLRQIMLNAKEGDNLKKILTPQLVFGPALLEHCLLEVGIKNNSRLGTEFKISEDLPQLFSGIQLAEKLYADIGAKPPKGYIIQKKDKKVASEGDTELLTYNEFHPYRFKQHEHQPIVEFDSFGKAVDEFFSQMESQKLELKVLQQEKNALKKLENVKKDHVKRIDALKKEQDADIMKAKLIEMNLQLVDNAITVIQSALANQIDWLEIDRLVKEAQTQKDPVASTIKGLKLASNHITLLLKDPYDDSDDDGSDATFTAIKPMKVDIDLGLSAFANARKYYDMKKTAASKEQKTLDASDKALKSAERKTKQTLKEVAVSASINKARKTHWFEKFLWFISSENYLIIGGRDQQQNELVVKRYLRPGDLYVHADLHGASSVIIKNPGGGEMPPKTLNEAGTMAVCNSAAWDAKVVTSAWYVHHDQVSKTAPSGEYLSTGSFMIRGKKNYLPPCYLVYGFSFLFKLDDDCIAAHAGERRVKALDDGDDDERLVADTETTNQSDSASVVSEKSGESDASDEPQQNDPCEDNEESLTCKESKEVKMEDQYEDNEESSTCKESKEVKEEEEQYEDNEEQLTCVAESQEVMIGDKREEPEDLATGGFEENKTSADNCGQSCSEVLEEAAEFPDTDLTFEHVTGQNYTLSRGTSQVSSTSDSMETNSVTEQAGKGKARLSAKQKRAIKKRNNQQDAHQSIQIKEDENQLKAGKDEEIKLASSAEDHGISDESYSKQTPQQAPLKRGQKKKLKKIQEKYGDQDEEERRIRMNILASAGAEKEKPLKGKKAKQQRQAQRQELLKQRQQQQYLQRQAQKGVQVKPGSGGPRRPLTVDDIKVETLVMHDQESAEDKSEECESHVVAEVADPVLDDDDPVTEDIDILASLTGQPTPDDVLLYSLPVCAPYSALINYKYKVKLTPGTTKRGKAAKTALNMYLHDKAATQREKELLKSTKDTDLSRYMPGKVKISAPNLHKSKKKK